LKLLILIQGSATAKQQNKANTHNIFFPFQNPSNILLVLKVLVLNNQNLFITQSTNLKIVFHNFSRTPQNIFFLFLKTISLFMYPFLQKLQKQLHKQNQQTKIHVYDQFKTSHKTLTQNFVRNSILHGNQNN
jgi:hypothetical protein